MWWVEEMVYWGHSGVTVGSAQGMYSHCAQLRFSLKHSGQDPRFLTICWVTGVWGPVLFQILGTM